jgi:CRP/FNR family transcriptional regulator
MISCVTPANQAGHFDPCAVCKARDLAVCSSLADEGLKRLGAASETVHLAVGETLVREGDQAANLFTITEGVVRVYKLLADGRRQIVGFLYPGDMLGLASGDRYAFEAEALEPVTACRFRKGEYKSLLRELPDLEAALLDRACHELQAAQDQMLLLGRKSAAERLASFLLDLASRDRRSGGTGKVVRLPMTRGEIADYLGLTTETVSRTTTRLKTRGVIRLLPHNAVEIVNPAALQALAGGEGDEG